jgi:UDP-N-acetylmuramoyl-tripeptide--D-alanyl-D-alanine ligase
LNSLGQREKTGRKIVVLTDMLELGPDEAAQHAGLGAVISGLDIDRVYLAGPLMQHLWDALPERLRGQYAVSAAELTGAVIADLQDGDVIMVKGSNGSKAGLVAQGLLKLK